MNAPLRDLRHLPDYAFGHRMPIWWGTLGFMVIEGSAFLMAIAAYAYLASQNPQWPLSGHLPRPLWGGVLAAWMLLSELPNFRVKRVVKRFDVRATRIGLVVMSLVGLGAIAIRAIEIASLDLRWDSNAFGSMVWALLFLHTTHIVVDVAETCVLTGLAFLGPLDARRFVDFSENAEYWDFVVLSWLPIYAVIYWAPRWFS